MLTQVFEMTNQQIAEEILRVLSNTEYHNTAWALKEVLEKLRELISGTNENVDWQDELNVMYVNGWDDALKQIDAVCDELEAL
jgi:hypothetical protein